MESHQMKSHQMKSHQMEKLEEQQKFNNTMALLEENVKEYQKREKGLKKESDDLYAAVTKGGQTELYNQLAACLSILEGTKNTLRKNMAAREKPYFGRIDFADLDEHTDSSLYIGKNGISRNQEVVIVDWRAPVSAVYYENEMGLGNYQVPVRDTILTISVDLKKKRTYDVDEGKLLGYYDNDVASNDDLLVKYLSKNKDAVLGDIIATIQKEQNEIIRDRPFKNMIVQGVAGSGKTTVAMHRISYLLYNFEGRIHPSEFCIIGSNDMLLSYITSGLPELDVSSVRYMRMDRIFQHLLDKHWKKSFTGIEPVPGEAFKARLSFMEEFDRYLLSVRAGLIPSDDVRDQSLGVLLGGNHIRETIEQNPAMSAVELAVLINEKIKSRIGFLSDEQDKDRVREKKKQYRKYFEPVKQLEPSAVIYLDFMKSYLDIHGEERVSFEQISDRLKKSQFDVYDMAALLLTHKRLTAKAPFDEFRQIIVDEGQDFGESVYYVLNQTLDGCYFTIMGDVSQNINYQWGMNDWEVLRSFLFRPERDGFYLLSKSYRNTIEISEFAGEVLKKASEGKYRIQPVIRHGLPVWAEIVPEIELFSKAFESVKKMKKHGHKTIAVICRDEGDAGKVKEGLGALCPICEDGGKEFQNGVMVLPIRLTKGLEFDGVILWKPDDEHYSCNEGDAKLLYVAITRALHELVLIGNQRVSQLCSGILL